MCGICGIVSREARQLNSIFDMNLLQSHRGPDGEGYLFIGSNGPRLFRNSKAASSLVDTCGFIALAHRRLAIIDCSDAGLQPMNNEESTHWISYNGEIYNYIELRNELKQYGHRFNTETDTEVVLAAYRQWGSDCFKRFNGMWALALWDDRNQRLVLSRDRFGIKPLHYRKDPDVFAFSSEIKPLLVDPEFSSAVNLNAVAAFLKWGLVNHNIETFFKDIFSFPPGHFAEIDLKNPSALKVVPYWNLNATGSVHSISHKEAANRFSELLLSSVKLRMRSDVPVGSCLSGGLDSSSIVCLMAKLSTDSRRSLTTITAGTPDSKTDETPWARIVSDHVNSSVSLVYPNEDKFIADLDSLIWHQEEPFTTASIYAQWLVMQSANQLGVPVLLDGQGADEILCGYRKFYLFHLQKMLKDLRFFQIAHEILAIVRRGDRGLFHWTQGHRYLPAFMRTHFSVSNELLLKAEFKRIWKNNHFAIGSGSSIANRQVDDITRFSVPSLLRYEDRNSMAWSIESRVPFLDYRLVDFLINLPVETKIYDGRTKYVLRKGMAGIVPQAILDRRDKIGFIAPQQAWMKGRLGEVVHDELGDGSKKFRLYPILQCDNLIKISKTTGRKSIEADNMLFRLLILNRWMHCFNVDIN